MNLENFIPFLDKVASDKEFTDRSLMLKEAIEKLEKKSSAFIVKSTDPSKS